MKFLSISPNIAKLQPSLVQTISPVVSVILAQALFIGALAIVGRISSPLISLVTLGSIGFGCLWALHASCGRLLFGKQAFWIIGIAFLTRLGVGSTHYITVINPEYFSNPDVFVYLWDFQWFHESLQFVSSHWHSDGLLAPLPEKYWVNNKNALLLAYCAIGYYFSGDFALTVAVWNSLHSVYTAFIVAALAGHLGANRQQRRFVLAFLAFQPFGMISSMMARDYVGQTWLAIAVYLLIALINWRVIWLLSIPLAGLLAISVRQPYLIIILMGSGYVYLFQKKVVISGRILLLLTVLGVILFSGLWVTLGDISLGRFSEKDAYGASRILLLPFRLLRAVIGPFPWFQVFDDPPPPGVEFMPIEFLQVIFNLSLLLVAVPRIWRRFKKYNTVNLAVPFGILLFISGAFATGVHLTYITIGLIFLLPEASSAKPTVWCRCFLYSTAFFILANEVYWILGLKGSGILRDASGGY